MRSAIGGLRLAYGLLATALVLGSSCRGRPEQAETASGTTDGATESTATAERSGVATPEPRGETASAALSRYRLSDAPTRRVTLPNELHEISGLAATADGRLFAHGDEDAVIFELAPSDGRVLKRFRLAPSGGVLELGKKPRRGQVTGDFEAIEIVGDRFFLVTSNGVLLAFAEGANGASVPYEAWTTGLGERCEIEGMAHRAGDDALLLLCKQIHAKADRRQVAAYAWSLSTRRLDPAPRFAVPLDSLPEVIGSKGFNGSALAFAPGGASLVLVAGPQRSYLEISPSGRVLHGGSLDRTALPQPEGLAFLPDGTLLISSEGGKGVASLNAYAPH